jgi:hypothetical protein
MRRTLCALALALLCASWPPLSAQEGPSLPTASERGASADPSPTPGSIAARLSALSTMLSDELAGSQIDLAELRSSLEASRTALESSRQSLALAAQEARRRSLELSLWRGLALSAGLGLGGALAEGRAGPWLAAGAGLGALAGAAWGLAESWPSWIKMPKGEGE